MRVSEKELERILARDGYKEVVYTNVQPEVDDDDEQMFDDDDAVEHSFDAPKRHKYGARKTSVDGVVFDSAAEAKRYRELKIFQEAGEISGLQLQPLFVIQEPFTYRGKRHRAITYKADFMYRDKDGSVIVEDVKGMKTPVFRLKWKMLLHMAALQRWEHKFKLIQSKGGEDD